MSHPFDRYAAFTDLRELKEVSSKPLRKSVRANLLKCSAQDLVNWGKAHGWEMTPVSWCTEGFFVDREDRSEALGKSLPHMLGMMYMQEASSMLPVALLDPQPGETILDMSSAPGSKTTQIASRIGTDGVIVANDVQDKRIWSLISNLDRCGVTTAVLTRKVGQWFGGNMTEVFDRVLCDAPCTAEGTSRKDTDALQYCSPENIGKMARLQKELLESAIHATKVGGRIVYSTCTMTPEENEEVIAYVLNKFSDQVTPLDPGLISTTDFRIPMEDSAIVQRSLGIRSSFPAVRLWPQTFDTEGFFVCVLEKRAPTKVRAPKEQEWHRYSELPSARIHEVRSLILDWYGSDCVDEHETLIMGHKEQMMVMPKKALRLGLPTKAILAGLALGKSPRTGIFRLAHEMAALRGRRATKQKLMLSETEWNEAMTGKNLTGSRDGLENGDILLTVDAPSLGTELVVGRGILKDDVILNRLPRDIVRMFS